MLEHPAELILRTITHAFLENEITQIFLVKDMLSDVPPHY